MDSIETCAPYSQLMYVRPYLSPFRVLSIQLQLVILMVLTWVDS